MIVEIKLPEISENVSSGDVVRVLVSPGDKVTVDQPLIELETEKAAFEVPSTAAGVVKEINVKQGATINVGDVIARIDTEAKAGADAPAPAPAPEAQAAQEPANVEAATPSPPPPPAPSRPAASPTRSAAPPRPATPETPAPSSEAPARDAVQSTVSSTAEAVVAVAQGIPAPASPTVRRLARELGIDINQVNGSGPGGRISSEDVQGFAKSIITRGGAAGHPAPGGAAPAVLRPLPDFTRFGEIERVAMSKIRQATGTQMSYAWTTVPHVTQHDEADITDLEAARKRYGERIEAAGGKLTMTAILTRVCASAVTRFPDFNASIDVARSEIIYKKYVHIGIAVDTERRLLVPVIRNADSKNIATLAAEIGAVAEKARTKKIMPDDLEGAGFTISNLGGIGGTAFTPIVNAPEVAILGVSRAATRPVHIDGEFKPRLMLPLSLSYDHRLIDGAAAARFLRWVCDALEHPILLALEG